MATNDFKPFATGAGANVMSQADWVALAALATGFQSGKASSAQINKAIRQALFISSALAQYTADKSGLDVLDDGNVAGFIAKMSAAFGKDFQPLDATLTTLAELATAANKLPYFTGADVAALTDFTDIGRNVIGQSSVANLRTYLGLGASALLGVATNSDMQTGTSTTVLTTPANIKSIFPNPSNAASGYTRIPNIPGGLMVQWVQNITSGSSSGALHSFPTPFPNACLFVVPIDLTTSSAVNVAACAVDYSATTNSDAKIFVSPGNNVFSMLAIGF